MTSRTPRPTRDSELSRITAGIFEEQPLHNTLIEVEFEKPGRRFAFIRKGFDYEVLAEFGRKRPRQAKPPAPPRQTVDLQQWRGRFRLRVPSFPSPYYGLLGARSGHPNAAGAGGRGSRTCRASVSKIVGIRHPAVFPANDVVYLVR